MSNFMTCEECGAQMTGFGSLLFCPKEDEHIKEGKSPGAGFYLLLEEKSKKGESALSSGQLIYDYDGAYALGHFRPDKPVHIHRLIPERLPSDWMVPFKKTPGILGVSKDSWIGVTVEYVQTIS